MKNDKKILVALCGFCGAIKLLTNNEDAWGHSFAAAICGICTIAGGVATVDSINKAFIAGKATAKIVNQGADVTQQSIYKKFGSGPDLS